MAAPAYLTWANLYPHSDEAKTKALEKLKQFRPQTNGAVVLADALWELNKGRWYKVCSGTTVHWWFCNAKGIWTETQGTGRDGCWELIETLKCEATKKFIQDAAFLVKDDDDDDDNAPNDLSLSTKVGTLFFLIVFYNNARLNLQESSLSLSQAILTKQNCSQRPNHTEEEHAYSIVGCALCL